MLLKTGEREAVSKAGFERVSLCGGLSNYVSTGPNHSAQEYRLYFEHKTFLELGSQEIHDFMMEVDRSS